ncbi:MAG: Rne/Rng family ribonuclease, partial [Pseudomonadota bacterium]
GTIHRLNSQLTDFRPTDATLMPIEGSPGATGEIHEAVIADDQPAGDGDQSPGPVGDEDRVAEPDVSENETTIEPLGADTSTSDSAAPSEASSGDAVPRGTAALDAEASEEFTPEVSSDGVAGDDADPDASADTNAETSTPRKSRRRRRSRSDRKTGSDNKEPAAEPADASEKPEGEEEPDPADEVEQVGAEDVREEAAFSRTRLRRKYKIQDVIKVRQILLVQVVKEERGNKGAALTTYLSLAGRYCVLMPNTARGGGISRKIVNAGDRKRLREITSELDVPDTMGLIVRTAGAERTRAEIKRDYEFLIRQWEQIRELTLKSIAPTLIYEEGSLIKRSIRDIYSKEIDQISVEGDHGYREAKEYMKMLMPSHAKNVQLYDDPIPLFSRYQVESYLNGMFNPTVQLRSGGYIVIGVTEALVAIDVNSGRATKQGSIEETALQTNLEAADEVARQLRLRDLAGLIVIDFIDMDENRNNRAVEKRMKDRLKTDRARIQVGRISAFGLMEMSRQRLRPGMLEATTQLCPTCQGMGLIRSDESLTLSILREIEEEGVRSRSDRVTLSVPVPIANYMINHKRESLALVEERHGVSVAILADPSLVSPDYQIERSKSQSPRPLRQQAVVTAGSVVTDDDLVEEAEIVTDGDPDKQRDESGGRRRRGKRGGRRRKSEDAVEPAVEEAATSEDPVETQSEDDGDKPRNRRGRGRKRGGRNRKNETETGDPDTAPHDAEPAGASVLEGADPEVSAEGSEPSPDAGTTYEVAHDDHDNSVRADSSDANDEDQAMDDPDVASVQTETPAETSEPAAEIEPPAEIDAPDKVFGGDASLSPAPGADGGDDGSVPEDPSGDRSDAEEAGADPGVDPDPERPKRRGWWSFGRS